MEEFRNPRTTIGAVREYLKPESMQMVVKMKIQVLKRELIIINPPKKIMKNLKQKKVM